MPDAEKIKFSQDQKRDPDLKEIIDHLQNNNNDTKTQNYRQL